MSGRKSERPVRTVSGRYVDRIELVGLIMRAVEVHMELQNDLSVLEGNIRALLQPYIALAENRRTQA